MVIFILGASADIDPSGKLGSWLNACMLLSASISPAVFGWILLDQSLSEIYPYLMFFLLPGLIWIALFYLRAPGCATQSRVALPAPRVPARAAANARRYIYHVYLCSTTWHAGLVPAVYNDLI